MTKKGRTVSRCLAAARAALSDPTTRSPGPPGLAENAMADTEPTGLLTSLRRVVQLVGGTLRNRVELFVVEFQEERYRLVELMLLVGGALVLGLLSLIIFSGVIVFAFAPEYRIYVAAGLGLVYLASGLTLGFRTRRLLREQPFAETVQQVKKDWECFVPPK